MRLGEVGQIVTGKTPPTSNAQHYGEDVPFVTPSDMDNRKIISRTERSLTNMGVQSVRSARIPAGSIMVSCIGSDLGKVAMAGKDCVTNQQINSIIPSKELSRDFIYYALLPRKSELQILAGGGSAQPIINKGHFSQLEISIPPVQEQHAIALILKALDDKIELNRRMNETLEAIARAIFQSWFVDFDPVRAKAEGRQPFGMNSDTAALFPNSFAHSSPDEPPSGWRIGKMSELASLSRDSLAPEQFANEVFNHYSIPAFDEGRWPKAESGRDIKSNKFTFPVAAVLLSKLNPRIPRVWLPLATNERRSIASTEFLIAISRPPCTREYLYCLFDSNSFAEVFENLVTGTSGSHQRVKPEFLLNMHVLLPSRECIDAFTRATKPLLELVPRKVEESHTLAAIRDALLPKLISGEIRIKDAEKLVGEKV